MLLGPRLNNAKHRKYSGDKLVILTYRKSLYNSVGLKSNNESVQLNMYNDALLNKPTIMFHLVTKPTFVKMRPLESVSTEYTEPQSFPLIRTETRSVALHP